MSSLDTKLRIVLPAILLIFFGHLTSGLVLAQQEPLVFENPEQERRFADLTEELRCLVCQNQNLADSDAPLAHDLRQEIHEMLMAGHSDDEIKGFLVDRYGDFVLYRPPVKGNTLLLWLMPGVLLVIGALTLFTAVRRRAQVPESDTAPPPSGSRPGRDS
ncbi:cytochrome c-type biogenesis protein [Elongatibacter sediminis]|uniref:Cytochrome c-type biogenesis protein n=1 Tax=Elongatibacter sediminis TaxID=3119006 RepID=A0AAW9R9Q9_9GAMM